MSLPSSRPPWQKSVKSSPAPGSAKKLPSVNNGRAAAVKEVALERSHNNPLFSGSKCVADSPVDQRRFSVTYTQDARENTPMGHKELKENRDKQDQEFGENQQQGLVGSSVGKATKAGSQPFISKSTVKRKILAENREVVNILDTKIQEGGLMSDTPQSHLQHSSDVGDKSPVVSMDELEKRIQKFLQDEGAELSSSPSHCTDSMRRLSGAMSVEGSDLTEEDVPAYHPVFAPFSPRPSFLRARKSLTGAENDKSPAQQENETPEKPVGYDPKLNFLSPRPQFLRYRPLRRLELLRRGPEGMIDLDMGSPLTDDGLLNIQIDKSEEEEPQTSESSVSGTTEIDQIFIQETVPSSHDSENVCVANLCDVIDTSMDCQSQQEFEADVLEEGDALIVEEQDDEEDCLVTGKRESWKSIILMRSLCTISLFGLVALVLLVSQSPALLPNSLQENHISTLWNGSKYGQRMRKYIGTAEGTWKANGHMEYISLLNGNTVKNNLLQMKKTVLLHYDVVFAKRGWTSSNFEAKVRKLLNSIVRVVSNTKEMVWGRSEIREAGIADVAGWELEPEYDVVAEIGDDGSKAFMRILMDSIASPEVKAYFSLSPFDTEFAPIAQPDESFGDLLISDDDSSKPLQLPLESHAQVVDEQPRRHAHDLCEEGDRGARRLSAAEVSIAPEDVPFPPAEGAHGTEMTKPSDLEHGKHLPEVVEEAIAFLGSQEIVVAADLFEPALDKIASGMMVQLESLATMADEILDGIDELPTDVHFAVEEMAPISLQQEMDSVVESQDESGALQLGNLDASETFDRTVHKFWSFLSPTKHLASPLVMAAGFSVVVALAAAAVAIRIQKRKSFSPGRFGKATFSRRVAKDAGKKIVGINRVQLLRGLDGGTENMAPASPHPRITTSTTAFTAAAPETTHQNAHDIFVATHTPENNIKMLNDRGEQFMSPMEMDQSPYGSFTTMMPVVSNDGTGNERVRLTPVRRSNRIRSRNLSPSTNISSSVAAYF